MKELVTEQLQDFYTRGGTAMPGGEHRTSRVLLLLCMLMSAGCAGLLTESSSAPYVSDSEKSADVIVAEGISPLDMLSGVFESPDADPEEGAEPVTESVSADAGTEEDYPVRLQGGSVYLAEALPAVKSPYEVSPEAERGVWSWDGTGWLFMVDGIPYKGWLNDTDGKRYFLNSDGYMRTGWIKDDGERYYLDDDGIMVTGEVTVGKKTYIFADTGILQEEVEPTEAPAAPAKSSDQTDPSESETKADDGQDGEAASEGKTEKVSGSVSTQDTVRTAAVNSVKKKKRA